MINRKDWGLIWNTSLESGGMMLSEEIKIHCEVELTLVNQKELILELEPATYKNNK